MFLSFPYFSSFCVHEGNICSISHGQTSQTNGLGPKRHNAKVEARPALLQTHIQLSFAPNITSIASVGLDNEVKTGVLAELFRFNLRLRNVRPSNLSDCTVLTFLGGPNFCGLL